MISTRSMSMTRALAAYTLQMRCLFTCNGEPVPSLLILSPESFLPVVALHADARFRQLTNSPLSGWSARESEDAMLGVYVDVDEISGEDTSSSLRLLMFKRSVDEVFGIAQEVRIECAPIFDAYREGLMKHVQQGVQSWPMAQVSPR